MSAIHRSLCHTIVAGLLVWALSSPGASAQQIYKWTDANGQVHYTDQPPPDRAADTVATPPSPKPRPTTQAEYQHETGRARNSLEQPAPPGVRSAADQRLDALNEDYERRRVLAKREAEKAATKKAADDAVVAACERAHDTQCNKGAEFIREREVDLAHGQYADRKKQWVDGGRMGPPPRQPPARQPKTIDPKKK
jgi:hypothetical protein